jgi:hypothetical protein
MAAYDPQAKCPDCGHSWAAHQGRRHYNACHYRAYVDYRCPCKTMNPKVEADDEFAGQAWRNLMGYNEPPTFPVVPSTGETE